MVKTQVWKVLVPVLILFAGDVAGQWANPHPAEAKVKYPRGEAPFHVRVRAYGQQLDRLYEEGNLQAVEQWASALGVSTADLDAINVALSGYRQRETQAGVAKWQQECVPLLRGDAVTEAQARAAFERRDDIAWRELVAEQTLDELESRQGAALAEKVRQHIVERGESIEFGTSLFAKVIELGRGGLFLSHLMVECGTHPDYPKK